MDHIQQIITLQNIDSQLQDIAELLGDLPIKVESLKDEESSLITSLENGKLRLKELELGLNKFDGQLAFYTSSAGTQAVRMRIDETGNIGIGTVPQPGEQGFSANTGQQGAA